MVFETKSLEQIFFWFLVDDPFRVQYFEFGQLHAHGQLIQISLQLNNPVIELALSYIYVELQDLYQD